MLFVKIWIITVAFDIIWTINMRRYYKSDIRAAIKVIISEDYPWFFYLKFLLTIFNIGGLFYVLIYFLFLRQEMKILIYDIKSRVTFEYAVNKYTGPFLKIRMDDETKKTTMLNKQ